VERAGENAGYVNHQAWQTRKNSLHPKREGHEFYRLRKNQVDCPQTSAAKAGDDSAAVAARLNTTEEAAEKVAEAQ
jgi:hypothetical protein